MNKSLSLIKKDHAKMKIQEEKQRKIDQILKRQAEHDVLRPAGSRKYKNWNDVKSEIPDQSRLWF